MRPDCPVGDSWYTISATVWTKSVDTRVWMVGASWYTISAGVECEQNVWTPSVDTECGHSVDGGPTTRG
jgi:hypothetical protein